MNLVRCLLALVMIAVIGCGKKSSTADVGIDDYESFRTASTFYGMYQKEHRGQTPPDEQAFREFIESKQEILQKINKTADQLMTSPRNGEPLVFVYGKRPPAGPGGITYVAYEKVPVDGKRLVIGSRGVFEEMDDAQFKRTFPGTN